jgi:putative AlgH/UPF0301 family transcriptional regulator
MTLIASCLASSRIIPSLAWQFRLQRHSIEECRPAAARGTFPSAQFRYGSSRCWASGSNEDEDDDDDAPILTNDDDWRSFRAKLVMGQRQKIATTTSPSSAASNSLSESQGTVIEDDSDLDGIGALFSQDDVSAGVSVSPPTKFAEGLSSVSMTPLDPSQWAYDSGKVIEKGAVILGGVEQDFGFGLRQQYFHKAAILVLDHDERTFTKGIILNRATDLTLDDDRDPDLKWRVWFGGDVQGLDSNSPDIVCLHSITGNARVDQASIPVMKDIQWTTFENAQKLVAAGAAKSSDFWVFSGYAGWGPGQLSGELDRRSWYMVATDSQTLLKELARQSAASDPREAGLDTWTLLMQMIGREETARQSTGTFDDHMLKEWAAQHLCQVPTEGSSSLRQRWKLAEGVPSTQDLMKATSAVDKLIMTRVSAAARGEDVSEGSLVRASSAGRSPFLLSEQQLHKSLVLVLSDDENLTVGAILNRPAARGIEIQISSQDTGRTRTETVPLRYGGQFTVKSTAPLLWLHCHPVLRAAKIGSPVGVGGGGELGIWKCTAEDIVRSLGEGLVTKPEQHFMVVSGVSVWTKGERGIARGIQGTSAG